MADKTSRFLAAMVAIVAAGAPASAQRTKERVWTPGPVLKIARTLKYASPDVDRDYKKLHRDLSQLTGRIVYLDLRLVPSDRAASVPKVTILQPGNRKNLSCTTGSWGLFNLKKNVDVSMSAPGDHHHLLEIHTKSRLAYPFQAVLCQYLSRELRISGLFLVTEEAIPTAHLLRLLPVRFGGVR